jgi:hypothetical protein
MDYDDTWLTLGSAVVATGWKAERIRSLARRGTIQRKRGNGRDWLYQITPELVAARVEERAGPSASTDEAARWQAVAAELQEEVAELRIELGRAEERAAAREHRLSDLQDQLAREQRRAEDLAAELREARRPWLVKVLAAIRR